MCYYWIYCNVIIWTNQHTLHKAFDKVNLYGLTVKLMNRNVPKFFVAVIIDWYKKLFVKVRWNINIIIIA